MEPSETVQEDDRVAVLVRGDWHTGVVRDVLPDGRVEVALTPHPGSAAAPTMTVDRERLRPVAAG